MGAPRDSWRTPTAVPMFRTGQRELFGVDELYLLKQLGAVAGKAAVISHGKAGVVAAGLARPEAARPRLQMRSAGAGYAPRSALLRRSAFPPT